MGLELNFIVLLLLSIHFINFTLPGPLFINSSFTVHLLSLLLVNFWHTIIAILSLAPFHVISTPLPSFFLGGGGAHFFPLYYRCWSVLSSLITFHDAILFSSLSIFNFSLFHFFCPPPPSSPLQYPRITMPIMCLFWKNTLPSK